MTKAAVQGVEPLKDLLGDVLARLEALEAKVGVKSSTAAKQATKQASSSALNGKSQ